MTACVTRYDMPETRSRSIRIADDVWEAIQGLPGKTDDALRAILIEKRAEAWDEIRAGVAETLELVRGVPDAVAIGEVVRGVIEEMKAARAANNGNPGGPAAIPGAVQGASNLPPRPVRESGSERAQRERRERQERAASLDSVDDESFDRGDDYVSN